MAETLLLRVTSVFVLVAETLLRDPLVFACEPLVRILSFGSKTVDPLLLPELCPGEREYPYELRLSIFPYA